MRRKQVGIVAVAQAAGIAWILCAVFRRSGWFFDQDGYVFVLLLTVLGAACLLGMMFMRRKVGGMVERSGMMVMRRKVGGTAERSDMMFMRRKGGGMVERSGMMFMRRKSDGMAGRSGMMLSAAVWLCLCLSLFYAIGLLTTPVTVQGNLDEALRWAAYASFLFLLSRKLTERQAEHTAFSEIASADGIRPLGLPLPVIGYGLQLFCLFAVGSSLAVWFGWIDGPDYMLRTTDIRLSASGARLAGYLQYSNSLGAFATALLTWQWLLLVRSHSQLLRLSGAILAVPCLTVLILTESRGAGLVLLTAVVSGILLVPRGSRLRWIGVVLWTCPGAIAALGLAWMFERGGGYIIGMDERMKVTLLLLLLFGSSTVILLKQVSLERAASASVERWIELAVMFVLAYASTLSVLNAGGSGRFNPLENSALATGMSRLSMYKDGWNAFQESWLLGYGAKAWEMLRGSFQSAPYAASEVHSGYLDMLLTGGVIGFLLLAGLGIMLLYAAGADSRLCALPVATLLLHAAVDVDMSYGVYWLLLFAFAAAAIELGQAEAAGTVKAPSREQGWLRRHLLTR
ncbi:O-Antigen ligase [Paenibacillaceae bacterium GAS479]|nr:O-Antigen ligase [Paenibacillaceae bacterium GAS479]